MKDGADAKSRDAEQALDQKKVVHKIVINNHFQLAFLPSGDYSFTVVTGLVDIGRGGWRTQGRTYREYLTHMLKVLRLDVNLIVFIEPKGLEFVKMNRRGRENRTVIYPTTIEKLSYYPLLPRIQEIMNTDQFKRDNDNYKNGNCEAFVPQYNLLTNSKVCFVHQAIRENPFRSTYFIWIDGGYGHGETEETDIYPSDGIWSPKHLTGYPNQVTVTIREELPTEEEKQRGLYKLDEAWIAGGLYGGGIQAMEIYYQLHKQVFLDYLNDGIVDDDQTTFLESFYRNRTNFRLLPGSWHSLMKPFS
ncbi:protein htrl-like [Plakobranchus ocellatus]|uniref:Protein htrl-like n=1 Tax=Plakobranchus ocellatus TaxID=259542 RepID=A0AAV4CK82_9GAST|nr:protein htrl-like [Plakobranchus ocellatus]